MWTDFLVDEDQRRLRQQLDGHQISGDIDYTEGRGQTPPMPAPQAEPMPAPKSMDTEDAQQWLSGIMSGTPKGPATIYGGSSQQVPSFMKPAIGWDRVSGGVGSAPGGQMVNSPYRDNQGLWDSLAATQRQNQMDALSPQRDMMRFQNQLQQEIMSRAHQNRIGEIREEYGNRPKPIDQYDVMASRRTSTDPEATAAQADVADKAAIAQGRPQAVVDEYRAQRLESMAKLYPDMETAIAAIAGRGQPTDRSIHELADLASRFRTAEPDLLKYGAGRILAGGYKDFTKPYDIGGVKFGFTPRTIGPIDSISALAESFPAMIRSRVMGDEKKNREEYDKAFVTAALIQEMRRRAALPPK